MNLSEEWLELFEHLEWADAEVLNSVLAAPQASADEKLRNLLIHSHEVQWAYLQLWRGDTIVIPERSSFADLFSVMVWARDYHARCRTFLSGLSSADLERHIAFPWADQLQARFGRVHPTTLRESMLQVALHSAYHRGQVATRLRELGGEPPLVDFVAWIWRGRPAPAGQKCGCDCQLLEPYDMNCSASVGSHRNCRVHSQRCPPE